MCDRAEKRSLSFFLHLRLLGDVVQLSVTNRSQHGILERDASNVRYLQERGRDYQLHGFSGESGEGEVLLIEEISDAFGYGFIKLVVKTS